MPGWRWIAGIAGTRREPSLAIRRERCTRYRHRASTCSRCAQACPSEALRLSENGFVEDAAACTGCGACASACPTAAIEVQAPDDAELAAKIAANAGRDGAVALVCDQATPEAGRSVSVACLARLDPSLLLHALAQGASAITLVSGDCAKCATGQALPRLHDAIAMARDVAEALGVRHSIALEIAPRACAPMRPAGSGGLARRRFFSTILGKETAAHLSETAVALRAEAARSGEARAGPHEAEVRLPDKRKRLVASLRGLAAARAASAGNAVAPLPAPTIDAARCIGCAICADACPTAALAAEQEAERIRITCSVAGCVACSLCADVCCTGAVSLRRGNGVDSILSPRRRVLLERSMKDDLLCSVEEKMSRLLGTRVYRT